MANSFFDFKVNRSLLAARIRYGLLSYVLVRVKGLISVPFYSHYLGAEGLGVYTLIGVTVSVIWPVFILNLNSGLATHVVHLKKDEDIRRAFYSVFHVALVLTTVGVLLMVLFLGHSSFWQPLLAVSATYAVVTVAKEVAIVVPQVFQMTRLISIFTVVVEYLGLALSLGLVMLGFGASGAVAGLSLALGIGALWLIFWLVRKLPYYPGIDMELIKKYLAFSLPLLLVGFSQWAILGSDNYFLLQFHGASAVGVYSVAYTLASVLLAIPAVLNYVSYPTLVRLRERNPQSFAYFLNTSIRLVVLALSLSVVLSYVLGNTVVSLLAGPQFMGAARILPLIFGAQAFFILAYFLQGVYVALDKNPLPITLAYLAATGLNLVLNIILINRWSLTGAALATLISYLLLFFLILFSVRRRLGPTLSLRSLFGLMGTTVTLFLVIFFMIEPTSINVAANLLIAILITVCLPVVSWMLRLVTPRDLGELVAVIGVRRDSRP